MNEWINAIHSLIQKKKTMHKKIFAGPFSQGASRLNILFLLLSLCGAMFYCSTAANAASAAAPVNRASADGSAAHASKANRARGSATPRAQAARPQNKQTGKQDSTVLTIATRSLIHKDDNCSVMVNYPQVGSDKIDAELDFWASKTVRTFVSGIENFASGEATRYSMLVDYELTETSGRFISIVFRISTETGGSHPDSGMVTFTYDLSDGRKLEMHDIFGDAPGLLQFLSLYSYENLLGQLGQEFENSIKHGTSPNILNFSLFALRPEGLVIYFPPYQVADYRHGERQVTIGSGSLKAFKPRADLWRGSSGYGSISGNPLLRNGATGEMPGNMPFRSRQ